MVVRIIPDIDIDNERVESLLANIHNYKNLAQRIKYNRRTSEFVFLGQERIAYEILLTKEEISFYLAFCRWQKNAILNELNICWPKATFTVLKEDYLKNFNITAAKEFELQHHFFLSIRVDKRGLFPLPAILETSRLLRANEKALIQIVLVPEEPSWYLDHEAAIQAFQKGYMTEKRIFNRKNITKCVAKLGLAVVRETLSLVSLILTDQELNGEEWEPVDKIEYANLFRKGLSENTLKKGNYLAYDTTLRIALDCPKERTALLLNAFSKCFNELAEDNRFVEREVPQEKLIAHIKDRSPIFKFSKDLLSTHELSQLVQMPTKTYQMLYNIQNIDNKELDVPSVLLRGVIPIGTATYRGEKKMVYWAENKNIMALPKIIVGPMGSGKTEYIKNFVVGTVKRGDSVIVFDYIKECELSNAIAQHVKDSIVLDLSKIENISALSYPELQPRGDSWERLKIANMLARQTEYLINSLAPEPLSPRMSRYLDAACKVVFIHQNAKISHVIDVLTNWQTRNEYIRKAKYSGVFKEDDPEIQDLQNLHERDNTGKIIGTKETKLEGITDRFNILTKDIYLRAMCYADINYTFNFCDFMDQGKVVLIQIPEHTFTNKQVKDTLVTYYMSRIWLAALQRKTDRIVHVITDEIHQVPTAAKLVSDNITEARKFGVDYVFTLHYLRQFRALHDAVKSAGASYMLLAGTEKENIRALEEEIKPFTIEDALRLKPYHSLNVVNYGNEYARFITKLPPPLR